MEAFRENAYNESFLENGFHISNVTDGDRRHQYNYYAMLLTLLIFVIVFGNVLVCMAVSREKALQTTTNYLIVSLAVADLLVATLVMPWVVYLEVVGEWRFSTIHCDIFVTLDVMMCTASILNLCAISIDRYTAVAMPMLYNTRYSSKRRVTVMISVVWILSFAISCPLLFGLNNTESRDDALCVIANPAFVVYSSVVSFYVPFIITLLVYVQIYVVLRKRRKRVSTKRTYPSTTVDTGTTLKIFIKEVVNNGEDVQMDEVTNPEPANQRMLEQTGASQHGLLLGSNHSETDMLPAVPEASIKPTRNGNTNEAPKVTKAFETQVSPSGKMQTSVKSFNKRKISQQKEKKATQMLAIVLGVFIICWLPFFITHIVNTYCHVPAELYTAFTWLGYVNSAVNPIIYTTFNIEFRKAFIKILHC
ncbi:dopamine receptor D2a isoform X2 [Pygocentrus nattereri]|uniref:G-protein coupled receptors family 1 profile domain-containing protein n=1 Tax=Pygocentrus nattereri TaxID=42514 RepID=A0A3B4BTN5_PYGNA|nr:dopamine receptor D2a isoform X2 [Pygocentrus nattereri]